MATAAATTNVPPSAQKQIREAQKLYDTIYGNKDEGEEVAAAEQESVQAKETPAKEAPTKAEAKPEPEKAAPAQEKTEPDYKAQYDALKGKYNKEVVPLQQQVRSLTAELDSLRTAFAAMESGEKQQAPAKKSEDPQERYITDADVEDFGEDTIDLIRRVAREESQAKIRELERRNTQLERQLVGVGQTVQVSARERLLGALDSQVPNWREINTDDSFLTWLQDRDPYAGVQRHTMLKQAYENNDAARVIAFFRGYLGEHAVVSERPPAHAEQGDRQPQVDMETLVAPGKPKGSSVRAQEDGKRMWSQNEIRAFYRDVQNRKFVGREKEKERIERDIVAAASEGRIVA